MNPTLPPAKLFRQFCRHEDGWTDHYGSLQLAAVYAGVALPPRYTVHGLWQHGCLGPWEAVTPGALVFNAPGAQARPALVARQEEADFLIAHGYPHARAIGVPIIYTPPSGLARLPRSLLVMPTHTLIGDKYPDRTAFIRYADEVRELAKDFDHVTVCIHPGCQRNGLWFSEFTERGFDIVLGAQTNDAHALHRMRALFEQYETVTTNGWGSHVAYALAFGAKVAIHGTKPVVTEENLLRDLAWSVDTHSLKLALAKECQRQEREFLREFLVPPTAAVANAGLGGWLVGAGHKLDPEQMRPLLTTLLGHTLWPLAPVAHTASAGPRVLFVAHEASRTGAPMFLLHLLRWLRANTDLAFDLLLAKGGALQEEFAQLAIVHEPKDFAANPDWLRGYDLIYSNTCCNGNLLEELGCGQVPVITHVHELDTGFQWLGARSMAAVVRQSSRYIACAGVVATRLRQVFNLPVDRVSVHYEMIDPAVVAANAAAADAVKLRQDYDLPADAFIVTGCGTFDTRKAPDVFVQLAARLKRELGPERPLRFLWIGAQNTPALVRMVRDDVRKLGLEAEVRLIAELPSPHGLIALSDLFCLTSREDPFPLVMLEAALLEKPVLCFTGAGGAGEFCAAGGGLAVPYLDVPAMAELARDLLRDPVRRAGIGRHAAAVVRERFSVEVLAPELWREVQGHLRVALPVPAERHPGVSLADIFRQWSPSEAPQLDFIAAHLAREKLRRQARHLVAEGRRREAVQLLVKAVGADLATRDPQIICECLVEIAHDLDALDPRQAATLLDKAKEVARSTGIRLEQFRPREKLATAA